ncbi:MAG: hypothetical protein MJZ93_03970 [Paludibacteraceae bacterium]|nr:hypothetical protein [Paludibacteraceae bacterium]
MDKTQILNALKNVYKLARFPRNIDFFSEDNILHIKLSINSLINNMQTDCAAFEGWAIVLKTHLGFNKIVLSWEEPDIASLTEKTILRHQNGKEYTRNDRKIALQHYQRFCYRVHKFAELYDWFSSCQEVTFNYNNLLLNYPTKGASKKAEKEEAKLERLYVQKHSLEFYGKMDHQLPLTIFRGTVSSKNQITSGSTLDIWSINENHLNIYELKKHTGNDKVGIITEILYYVNVLDDLFKHKVNYEVDAAECSFRSFNEIYHLYNNAEKVSISGLLLCDRTHPLIDEKVLKLMSDNVNDLHFEYKKLDVE